MEIPRELSDFDKELLSHIKILSFALASMLKKDEVLDVTASTTGDELIQAAAEYCRR